MDRGLVQVGQRQIGTFMRGGDGRLSDVMEATFLFVRATATFREKTGSRRDKE
jgi:hypothetical protein